MRMYDVKRKFKEISHRHQDVITHGEEILVTSLWYTVEHSLYLSIFKRTRQIIRYRATATLRRPQNKQYSASKEQYDAI